MDRDVEIIGRLIRRRDDDAKNPLSGKHHRMDRFLATLRISVPLSLLFLLSISSAFSQQRVTLRLADWASLEEITVDKRTIAAFQRRHPGIEVLYEPAPGPQYEEKILTALATDDPPDVFLLDSKLIPTFTNKKILLDLTPFVGSLHIDTAQWFSSALRIARRGDALYAFPKGFTPLMIYYNRKLFDAASLPYPRSGWTWDDYLRFARQLTTDQDGDGRIDQHGTIFTNYYYFWIPWVWSAGGDVLNPEGTRATGYLNSATTEAALQFLIDLRLRHRVAPDIGSWVQSQKTGAGSALFSNGKAAMIIDGHWRLPDMLTFMREKGLSIGIAPLPSFGRSRVNVLYESGWCVPVNARHSREAALLAAFMAGEEACRIRSEGRLEIPSVRIVAEEFARKDSTGFEAAFLAEVPFCRQPWGSIVERFSEIELTLQDAVDEVLLNGRPLHATLTDYASRIDRELANIRSHAAYSFRPIRRHSDILWFLSVVAALVFGGCLLLYLRANRSERFRSRTALAFLAPSLLHLTVFVFTPILFAAWLSFHRWDIVVPDKPFVGFDNFREILGDAGFWNAVRNTFLYTLNVPIGMAVSLAVALLMHRRLKGISFLRTLYFLPSVTSLVAIALVWMWLYHPSYGAANFLLDLIGIAPLQWLNSPATAMPALVIFSIWLGLGYQMVIFLAGLQGIPDGMYEAARLDGATGWQRFRYITLPLLRPTTFFLFVTSFIGSFQVFTSIYVMTAGGPVRSTDVMVYHIYQAAWNQLRMGYASALSWILFFFIMIATWIQFRIMGKEIEYG